MNAFTLATSLVSTLSGVLDAAGDALPDKRKAVLDDIFDVFEKHYPGSPVVIGMVQVARRVLDIPDDIGGDPD